MRGIDGAVFRLWLTCDCGKRHTASGISVTTVCACGRKLWARAFDDNALQDPPDLRRGGSTATGDERWPAT